MPLTIKVRKDGPYAVDLATGDFTLIDHDGNVIPLPELKPGKTTITLVPIDSNCPRTSSLALCPIETIAVTAAMPMTTPRTVRPARSLFFARARRATRRVRNRSKV